MTGIPRSWVRTIAAVLTAVCLAGCAGAPPEPPPGTVRIGPQIYLTLPRPDDLGRVLEAAQLVVARYGDQTYTFECRLSATGERFSFVGLDMLGRRALSVVWTDSGVTAEKAAWLPEALRPEQILADMVLLYWPAAIVRQSLSGGKLEESASERAFKSQGKEAIRIEYRPLAGDRWTGRLTLRNIAWGYELEIQSTVLP